MSLYSKLSRVWVIASILILGVSTVLIFIYGKDVLNYYKYHDLPVLAAYIVFYAVLFLVHSVLTLVLYLISILVEKGSIVASKILRGIICILDFLLPVIIFIHLRKLVFDVRDTRAITLYIVAAIIVIFNVIWFKELRKEKFR